MSMVKSVEVVVPQILLPHVYGENKTNLGHITQVGLEQQICSCLQYTVIMFVTDYM